MFSTERRGQVGIGTLIVFIAMVLVAAIAAGVLINTAGLLQAQAQQTGEETTAEVSNVIQIGEVIGKDTGPNGKIDQLNASIRLASGSDPINVSKASYTISTNGNATVVNGNATDSTIVDNIDQKQGLKDGETILSEQEDLIVVTFDLDATGSPLNELDDNDEVTFIAQAPAGGSTYKQLSAPRRIKEGESYIL
ncbi:archaellin/type IV pilin N-terminal domain-containing protein [Halonotius sp. GCM10025705]|uniref:archaellin/type IV pilin N-terminal domain-containing protein n=1 Tax=Halonotius sp. GCM10025705 TaxID=3252678 RepID=UPI003619EE69